MTTRDLARTNNYALTEDVWYLFARLAALEAALRAVVDDDFNAWGSDWTERHWRCHYCHAEGADINDEPNQDDHQPTCPWRAARALVGG